MLVLSRKEQERIVIDGDIVVTVLGIDKNGQVRIGIDAPKEKKILRGELIEAIQQENAQAAAHIDALQQLLTLGSILPQSTGQEMQAGTAGKE